MLVTTNLVSGIALRAVVASGALRPSESKPDASPLEALIPNLPVLSETHQQNEDRITLLILGADTRPAEYGYRTPTDTLILVSIDKTAHTAGMVSIPRDLYVDIPGYGPDRINTAYVKGGGQLAIETIKANFGIEVDHYVLVQFDAFTTVVDEIGGIDVYVAQEIYDPEFPAECYSRDECGFDPLYIPAGQQHMDGITALKYARVRHIDNDYERARRQQAVLFAIRDRVISFEMLPQMLQKAPTLYATVSDSIRTDMTLEELITLAALAGDLPKEDIRTSVIDAGYVSGIRSPEGASVLQPNQAAISDLLHHVFWMDE